MLQLPNVTLCCVDTKNHALALRAIERSRRQIEFARTLFLTDAIPAGLAIPRGIDVIPTPIITCHEDYSRIVLKGLYSHLSTPHILVVQWDGYVVNPDKWKDRYLDYDYLGAPWPDGKGGYTVGNGGFSLRSRRLLEALQHDRFPLITNTEDVTICGHHRPRLEAEFNILFAPVELAKAFSFEMDAADAIAGIRTFGFHGLFNLFLVEDERELIHLAAQFSDSLASSEMMQLLLKNLIAFGRLDAALALGTRTLKAAPDDEVAADVVVRARDLLFWKRRNSGRSGYRPLADRILRQIWRSGR
jgi:hypothetical protein